MNKVDLSVHELVGMIARGELRLPEMQRRYVWRSTRVRDLLDSLYRGYPSGAILVWETDTAAPSRDLAVAQDRTAFATQKLLLDGQQRLTSLYAILRGETVQVRGRKRPIDVLFNLDHPEALEEHIEVEGDEQNGGDDEEDLDEADSGDQSIQERLRRLTFVVANNALAALPNWVSVSKVMASTSDTELLKRAGVGGFEDSRYEKYAQRLGRLRAIRNYVYVMHLLERDLGYAEVAEIFVRVNSLGAKLRGSDLALAQITARWRDSLKLLESFQEECDGHDFALDLGLLVRALVVAATGQCRFGYVSTIPVERLKDGWQSAKDGLGFAINFLRANAKLEDESLLSSPFFLITISALAEQRGGELTKDEVAKLLRWVYIGSGKGRYSRGSSETLLDEDLATIRRGGGADGLLHTLGRQFGRLTFEPADFASRGPRSPVFPLVYLALKRQGATDWKSGVAIHLHHQGRAHLIQYHHIFPKARVRELYDVREVNEIANLAFISGRTNRHFYTDLPKTYLPKVAERGGDVLTSQCVPLDPTLWELSSFPAFLQERRALIADAVNALVETGMS
jgi:hypothetical protein